MASVADDPGESPGLPTGISAAAAEQYLQVASERALLNEAETAAHGYRFLTVEHGDAEDDEQRALVVALSTAAWNTGQVRALRGGSDYLTIQISPQTTSGQLAADEVLNQLELVARELNPGWWRIRRSSQ